MKLKKLSRQLKSERLTITLAEDQRRGVADIARINRTSVATVIRWAVDHYIAQQQKVQQ